MNVLHLLVSGGIGGIEILMKNYAQHSAHNNIFVFAWNTGGVAEAMERDGVRIYAADAGREGAYTTLKRIRQICLSEKIDIVVSHNSAPLLKLALIYIKLTLPNVRAVAYAHANARDICDSARKKGLLSRKLIHRMGFYAADGIVAISQSVKNSLKDYLHVNPNKMRVIYNGTPVNPALPEKCAKPEAFCLRLIYVGRLIPEKGVQVTLRSLSRVREEIPFTFTVVGDGSYREELEALTRELHLSDRVCFLGMRSDVQALLGNADVFIHLPIWEEGFGITAIEAMAAGLVCIVNNRGAMPEIFENGINGFVLNADNTSMLGDTLKYLMEAPPAEWKMLQDHALRKAQTFSAETFAEVLDRYLLEIS